MNHIYRLTWSTAQQRYVATAETSRGRHKAGGRARRALRDAALAVGLLGTSALALAAPTGAQISNGTAKLSQNGANLVITQSSQNLSLNWQSFNIAANESVSFVQPGASAVALNRVVGSDPSAIYGKLNANGQVFLINPNGVLFGKGAEVNVGGLVASTLNLSDASLLNGKRTFSTEGKGSGAVTNLGHIVADGGYVALLGGRVSNQGTLQANLGTVALVAGQQATLDFAGDKLISVQVERGALQALAENQQLIQADGGRVILTAQGADQLIAAVVNNSGVIRAQTLAQRGGVITLLGDMQSGQVTLGGTLDASAPAGGDGGFVETSAATVKVAPQAHVTTAAAAGQFGSWLVDPKDYTVAASGGDITGAAVAASLASTNVTLQSGSGASAGAGNVNVNDAISWGANTTLTLTASNHVNVNAPISATGANAGLAINPNTANGGEPASGSGRFNLGGGAAINLPNVSPASNTALVIGGVPYSVINSLGTAGDSTALSLQGMGANLGGHYALGSNIDASATATWNGRAGFLPVGDGNLAFSGVLDGLGHTISGLTINRPGSDFVGLVGQLAATGVLRNVGLNGGAVSGHGQVGALVGYSDGVLSNVNASSSVSGSIEAGGLVGANGGLIDNAYARGSVAGGAEIGGLAGTNYGRISNAYASGGVSGSGYLGGLVGLNNGVISSAYGTGNVAGTSMVGGLVGSSSASASISNVYASGSVTGSSNAGGLVGRNQGALSSAYWNSDVRANGVGSGSVGGALGLSGVKMRNVANFSGFTFDASAGGSGWVIVDENGTLNNAGGAAGATTPMLTSEYATTISNAHQLQLMALAPAAAYTLGANIDAAATGTGGDVWGARGFAPVGGAGAAFSGKLDGANHSLSGLTINAPANNYVGLFGNLQGTVRNLGMVGGAINGNLMVGALAGKSDGTVENVYASTAVSGVNTVGGLVGYNTGTVHTAYATGSVAGNGAVGGLVGKNEGSLDAVYASGKVSGSGAGGLVGTNAIGTLHDSVWNSDVNAQGVGAGGSEGAVGLSAAQSRTQGSYAPSWNFGSDWLIYEGYTAPLLRSFLTQLTVTANDVSKTYDRQAYSAFNVSYSSAPNANLLGTLSFGGPAAGATDAGSYAILPTGLYSNQQGYLIHYVAGNLKVKPAPLTVAGTIAADKIYDGGKNASLSGGVLNGVIAGDVVDLVQAGQFVRSAAGQGIMVTVNDSLAGAAAGNYTLTQPANLLASITPKQLRVDGSAVVSKVYDGLTSASITGGQLTGLVEGDSVKLTQAGVFASKNAGSGINVNVSAALSGSDAGNYTVLAPVGLTGDITAKQLTLHGSVDASKIYDGLNTATIKSGWISGVIKGDDVTLSQAGTFADKNVGKNKNVSYTNQLLGGDSANYRLASAGGVTTADILARTVQVQGTKAASKVYDGTTTADMAGGTVSGLIAGDAVGLVQTGSFADKNVGVAKLVNYSNTLTGVDAANYVLAAAKGTAAADVTARQLSVSGTQVATKVYDGSTLARLSDGTLVGLVDNDKVKLVQSGSFVTKNAGSKVAVIATDSLSGSDAKNYLLVQPTALSGTITAKELLVSAPKAKNKVYDASTAVTLTSAALKGVLSGDVVALAQNGAFADKNAGTGKVVVYTNTLTGADAGNYKPKLVGGSVKATITPLVLTVGGSTVAADKVYDGTTAATVSGGTIDGVLARDIVKFSQTGKFASARINDSVSVTYKNQIDGRDAANYRLSEKGGKVTAAITEF